MRTDWTAVGGRGCSAGMARRRRARRRSAAGRAGRVAAAPGLRRRRRRRGATRPRPGRAVAPGSACSASRPTRTTCRSPTTGCEGFENKIAELLAAELGPSCEYNWRAQRRGFFRTAFKEGEADLVLGVPAGFDMAADDRPVLPLDLRLRHPQGPRAAGPIARRPRAAEAQDRRADDRRRRRQHAAGARAGRPRHRRQHRRLHRLRRLPRGEPAGADHRGGGEGGRGRRGRLGAAGRLLRQAVAGAAGAHAGEAGASSRRGCRSPSASRWACRKGNKELRDELDAILKKRKAEIDRILDDYGVPRRVAPPPKAGAVTPWSESRCSSPLRRLLACSTAGCEREERDYPARRPPFGGPVRLRPEDYEAERLRPVGGQAALPRSTASAATPTAAAAWGRR